MTDALTGTGVLELFCRLAAIDSPPGRERAVADDVLAWLDRRGLTAVEDDAGAWIGSEIGNLHVALPPTVGETGTPIFLNAHLDTVPATGPLEPVVADGVVRNGGGTILGADNKSAVAAMLVALERIVEERRPHAGVELVLTPMEEVGLRGAAAFDVSRLRARTGYCYDHAAPIGNVVLAAPTQRTLRFVFTGRAAHSGIAPEQGRSAVLAAARAIASMPLGRIDAATTANVGLIQGGVAGNIVPPMCRVSAEARSRNLQALTTQVQAMVDAATHAANQTECELDTAITSEYEGYRFARSHPAVQLAVAALEGEGHEVTFIESGGGADANVWNASELHCVNLCNGMAEIHTASEHIAVADLEAMVGVTLRLVNEARTIPAAISNP